MLTDKNSGGDDDGSESNRDSIESNEQSNCRRRVKQQCQPPIGLPALQQQQQQQQQQFVEEIDYDEIETEEVVGKGSFGVVWKGRWRGQYVAVKYIDTEGEQRAFAVEVRQLSRVAHPNIVRLYGACTKNPVCLVMEYAEGGSLYNVLHCQPQPKYTAAHAISWTLQCACGVAYLHNMKPKPLIHRDLKPPNLLLVFGGRTLKICDFGTACDLNTYMTNNKGSAAWMAPEVFEGSRYTEKCDVFSWGVILWEVLSRRKPFDDIGGSAYRIMWAVHIGQRPPLIDDCPKPIRDLLIRCWRKVPEERPSMNEVVRIMTCLSELFNGPSEPLEYSTNTDSNDEEMEEGSEEEEDDEENVAAIATAPTMRNDYQPTFMDVTSKRPETISIVSSASIASSNFVDINDSVTNNCIKSIDETKDDSINQSDIANRFQPLHVHCDPDSWETEHTSDSSWEIRNMAGLDKMLPKNKKKPMYSSTSGQDLDNVYRLLDAELRPVTPDHTCQLSQDIFQQHKKLAQEYLKIQTEIALVGQHKTEILKSMSGDTLSEQRELQKLQDEKESLVHLYRNLKRQLEIMRGQARSIVSQESTSEGSSVIPGDDGWVVVAAHHEPSRIS